MNATIFGSVAQAVQFDMARADSILASKGSILGYSKGVTWTLMRIGGVSSAVKRVLAGESIALVRLTANSDGQSATLAANEPGHIAEWDLATQGPILTTRGSFLAAWGTDLDISVTVAKRAGAAMFGGAGLALQRISGSNEGTVLVHGRGDFQKLTLAAGEERLVSTGNVAAFSSTVDYDIERVGGVKKTLFSNEGMFMTRLTGPGTVLLQTLKRSRPARRRR